MSISVARDIAMFLIGQFEADGLSPVEVNTGLCADFADSLERNLLHAGLNATTHSIHDLLSDVPRELVKLPNGLSWEYLTEIGFAETASHSWVEYAGLCFDAEAVEGVPSPFDLPCVRHAFAEIVSSSDMPVPEQISTSEWWLQCLSDMESRMAEIDDLQRRTMASPRL